MRFEPFAIGGWTQDEGGTVANTLLPPFGLTDLHLDTGLEPCCADGLLLRPSRQENSPGRFLRTGCIDVTRGLVLSDVSGDCEQMGFYLLKESGPVRS